ncbi:LysR family transcriptional regulator [Jeotgalibaca sp. MA1X17-3]|uniref:LysR family transcriptional regulator n=1 Tax=Jeotgalibaca sp. MA1X17-3 TaxID=2908211 RepID=UPI001F2190C4|nr:LysR family transcriptional regulator [Jeotgalibaca sp. MA1X17-3]UJF16147.1 LysR family transcriptional regulator [Jeotgalibaca sp. MA1X17-3]
MLDYRYQTFLTLATERSYTRTAQKLKITQPAVTQQIKQLQQELGITLFQYQGKQLYLTEKGSYLENQLLLLNQDIQQIQRHLHQAEDSVSLTFGATLTIGEYLMPSVINKYIEAFPSNQIDMVVENTKTLIERVEYGTLDFAFIEGDFNQNKLGFQQVSDEKFIAVCAPENDLWKEKRSIWDLFSNRVLIREQGSGTRLIFENLLHSKGVSLSSFSHTTVIGNIGAIKQLVSENKGISFLYRLCVEDELEKGFLKEISVSDLTILHPFHMIYLKKNREVDKIKEFTHFY